MANKSIMLKAIASLSVLAMLSNCVHVNKNNTYNEGEVGKNVIVSFGKIISVREVEVTPQTSGAGALGGGAAGGLAGSAFGAGRGNVTAIVAGAVIGAVAGDIAETELRKQKGIEYIIRYESLNLAKAVVQTMPKEEKPIPVGTCAMVQQQGNYQRVLPATDKNLCNAEDDSTTKRTKRIKAKKKELQEQEEE